MDTDRIRKLADRAFTYLSIPETYLRETTILLAEGLCKYLKVTNHVLRHAYVLDYIFSNITPVIDEGELIVGKHWVSPTVRTEEALKREEKARAFLNEVEFFAPGIRGHMAIDYNYLLQKGIKGIREDIQGYLSCLNPSDPERKAKQSFYRATLISLDAFAKLADRYRQHALRLAEKTNDSAWRRELLENARILSWVPWNPARTFREALQASHLTYFAVSIDHNSGFCLGRPDRYLYPYYRADLKKGKIDYNRAKELLSCLYVLVHYIVGTWPTALLVGGRDVKGRDVTNDLTRMAIEAIEEVGLVNPAVALAYHADIPEEILNLSVETLGKGAAKPAIFNDNVITAGMCDLGCPPEDACNWIHSTCVEITPVGCSNVWVASTYLNLLKPLEYIFNRGKPIREGKEPSHRFTGLDLGPLEGFKTFNNFFKAYKQQLAYLIKQEVETYNDFRRCRRKVDASPLLSCFVKDCLKRGKDIEQGGARYYWIEPSHVGLANTTDSLAVIKHAVYDQRIYTLKEIQTMLKQNFPSNRERLRLISCAPKYGNDIDEVDEIARQIVEFIYSEYSKYEAEYNSKFVPGFFCWVMHERLGRETAASPDGRRAGGVLADSAGAAQGRDKIGPTAAINSITKWNHRPALGGLVLNLKFEKKAFRGGEILEKLKDLIKSYMHKGGFEIQINVIDAEILKRAQREPERYQDLVVRVAGFSEYFCRLPVEIQNEIIARTAHM